MQSRRVAGKPLPMASNTNFDLKQEFFIGKKAPGKNDIVEWNEKKEIILVILNSTF